MSATDTPKKLPRWTFALWLLPIAGLVTYTFIQRSTANAPGEGEVFNPAGIAELEIKGVAPDGTTSWTELNVSAEPARDEKLTAKGREIYSKACAACHGTDGKGEGPLVMRLDLSPRPANFTTPIRAIKLRSTKAGTLPLDDDLFRSITRGLPGTAMLSFRNLSDEERWALVHFIKDFWSGDKRWSAAQPILMPKKLAQTPELMEIGRDEYRKWCFNCHGADGTGSPQMAYQVQAGFPTIRFAAKGGRYMLRGRRDEDLAMTLMTGSSAASPMMSFFPTFYEQQPEEKGNQSLWGTVYYTRSLIEAQK